MLQLLQKMKVVKSWIFHAEKKITVLIIGYENISEICMTKVLQF